MDNQDIPFEPNSQERELLLKLRSNPLMAAGMEEVIARLEQELASGADAHQAEEAAIEVLQKLGRTMLTQWAQRTEEQATSKACQQDPTLQKHAKKNASGKPPSESSL